MALAAEFMVSAFLSMIAIIIAVRNETPHIIAPTNSAVPKFVLAYIGGTINPLKADPSLDELRLTPMAKLSSLPLNQLETILLYATFIDSPPRPNTHLPINII